MPARTEAPRCARGGCSGRSRRHRNAPRAGRCREWVGGRRRRVRALCCSFRFCFGVAARLHGRPLPHMTTRRHQSVCAWRWCTCLASLGSAGAERKTGAVGGGGGGDHPQRATDAGRPVREGWVHLAWGRRRRRQAHRGGRPGRGREASGGQRGCHRHQQQRRPWRLHSLPTRRPLDGKKRWRGGGGNARNARGWQPGPSAPSRGGCTQPLLWPVVVAVAVAEAAAVARPAGGGWRPAAAAP